MQNIELNFDSKKISRENSLNEPIIKNPFVHKLTFKVKDKIKLLIGAVLLLPVRLFAILILILISYSIGFLITIGLNEQDLKDRPLKSWRLKLRIILRFLARTIAFCFGFHKIKKNGKRATRKECTVFVAAPHSSFLDAFLFFILGLPIGVSKYENSKIPFIGRVIKSLQPILVTREDNKNKQTTIEEIKKRSDPNSNWTQVLVFPEGTTTNRTCLISFKPGAFVPQLPVQPVLIEYKNKLDTITWTWQGLDAFKVTFLTLSQFNNKMEITFLPVYYPNKEEKENPNLYATNVRKLMASHLNLSTTHHTYEDCRLMCRARELNLPFDSAIIEFSKLKDKLGINYDNCKELLEKYAEHARKSDGKMSLIEFCKYLNLPPNNIVELVFKSYDRNKDGYIDFREFVIGLSLISRPENTHENMRLAFEMFNRDDKNYIKLDDLQSILYSSFSLSYEETKILFEKINTKKDGQITYDEFYAYASEKPEYAKIFSVLIELKILKNNIELQNLAHKSEEFSNQDETIDKYLYKVVRTDSNISLTKRPLSDKIINNDNQNKDLIIEDISDAPSALKRIEFKNE